MAPATGMSACSASRSSAAKIRASITGRGSYVDDLKLPGMTYAAFVRRSPHAHARIKRIDTASARAHPGVGRRSRAAT